MTKEEALNALEKALKEKWQDAKNAFDASRAGATSDQSKSEGKYDTRATEEAYLAHGLSNSVSEYEKALEDLTYCRTAEPQEKVALSSLIKCDRGGEIIYFLLNESGGGIEAEVNGEEITIITTQSPLAQKMIGKGKGERLTSPPFIILQVL